MIDYVESWRKRLLARLYWQFKKVADWQAMAAMLAVQSQDLEEAAQTLLAIVDINTAEGAQLDLLGRVVQQQRLGASDAIYRMYLKARILVNRSGGSPEHLYKVFNALLGPLGYSVTPGGTKQFVLRIWSTVTTAQSQIAAVFLRDAKEAGAAGVLEFQPDDTADLFRFDVGPGFNVGVWAEAVRV